jgi:transcription factor TFIIIB component B''
MTGTPVVQIINGEIVLQESSLMVPGARRSVQEVEAEFNVVEEDAHMAIVGASYNSFVNRRAPQHWSVDETKRFYDALRQLGTDFCSMEAYFDNRTRKQLKRKYQIESAKNPQLIEMALNPKYHTEIGTSQIFYTMLCS